MALRPFPFCLLFAFLSCTQRTARSQDLSRSIKKTDVPTTIRISPNAVPMNWYRPYICRLWPNPIKSASSETSVLITPSTTMNQPNMVGVKRFITASSNVSVRDYGLLARQASSKHFCGFPVFGPGPDAMQSSQTKGSAPWAVTKSRAELHSPSFAGCWQ
jgi:hypothetical protein